MIIDQHCQTNATQAKLFVSSEPEIWYNNILFSNGDQRGLCEEYQSFIKKLLRCQCISGFSQFRVYGEINQAGEHVIVLTAEFRNWKDDVHFWERLEQCRDITKAHVWIMEDDVECDIRLEHNPSGMSTIETFGPNHGREYMQVEFSWRIESMNYKQIEALVERLRHDIAQIWEESGVGVC